MFLVSMVINSYEANQINKPFPSSPGPLFQNEGRCSAFDMKIIFHSHANKTHSHKKGCALCHISKVRGFGTRTWPFRDHFLGDGFAEILY